MIEVTDLSRSYGSTRALDAVSFRIGEGEVLCLLGHNGAGKSTLVSILATALPPSQGTARVAGYDVVREAREIRRRIGLTGQLAAVDENLSGRDNLILVARLLGASRTEARARADELLQTFALTGAADRAAATYSGGMRRRLDLASSFVSRPQVLFLDEPVHINAIGADLIGKYEVPLSVLKSAFVTPDHQGQALREGECQQLDQSELAPELPVLCADPALAEGRREQLTVFDSTGFALEDHIAFDVLLELAEEAGIGDRVQLEHLPEDALNPYSFQ
ncbi:ATP-binding cassette domain-containing protein [Streptomyces antimycoticus]